MSREPSRAQLSSRLAYQETVPSFLQLFKARASGHLPLEDSDSPVLVNEDDEWEDSGDGRPAIPRRPAIPERPKEGRWGSENVGQGGSKPTGGPEHEDDEDERDEEAPTIVVLREGKHLTAEEVENERRAAKGLPPIPKKTEKTEKPEEISLAASAPLKPKPSEHTSMSFSSSKQKSNATGKKRRILGGDEDHVESSETRPATKKPKKEKKTLLSFGDDER